MTHDSSIPIDPDLEPEDLEPPDHRVHIGPDVLALVALGGVLGASARYAVSTWVPAAAGTFPWATFWTNLSGSLLIGVVVVLILKHHPTSHRLRPFIATGLLGAFTTMSTYQVESALLIRDGHPALACAYALASLTGGVAFAFLGIRVGRRVSAA